METLWLMLATVAQTGNHFSMMEQIMGSGLGPPTHRHPWYIEGFYLLEGKMIFHVDGKKLSADPGTLVHIPRLLPHTFEVETPEVRILNFYAPGGSELIVMGLGKPANGRRRPSLKDSPPPESQEQVSLLQTLFGTDPVTAMPFSAPPSDELLVTEPGALRLGMFHMAKAADAAGCTAFGMTWRGLASGMETEQKYDLVEISAEAGARMPMRVANYDEALYIVKGQATLMSDGHVSILAAGAFAYVPAGSVFNWKVDERVTLLLFHIPGGFDRTLVEGNGDDARIVQCLEANGTRFI